MDRSDCAKHTTGCAVLLIALTALAGCNSRSSAPAPAQMASKAPDHLQRRATDPATQPATADAESAPLFHIVEKPTTDLQQPSSIDPQASETTADRPGDPLPPEPITSSVDVAAVKAETTSEPAASEFAINDEDAAGKSEEPATTETSTAKTSESSIPPLLEATAAQIEQPSTAQSKPVSEDPPKSDSPAVLATVPVAPPVKLVERPTEPTPAAAPAIAEPTPAAAELPVAAEPLPWGPSTPTPEMIAICKRAEETARHGFDLAERGALYTARAQFIEVLRTLTQANDAQRNTMAHSRALAAGLRAMEEVDDFVPRGTQLEADLNLQMIVDAHRTPVLKQRSLEGVTIVEAQRLYLTYAQEQLAAAAGDQPVTSLALYGMGKVCAAPAGMHGPREKIAECKAVVFYQTALIVEPQNFLSANELGVLLARFGRLDDARTVLERAVAASNAPTSWRNLAVVYERLGNAPRAQEARQHAEVAVAQLQHSGYSSAGMRYPINWLDPDSFARTNSMIGDTQSVVAPQQKTPPEVPQTAANPEKKSSSWPWGLK